MLIQIMMKNKLTLFALLRSLPPTSVKNESGIFHVMLVKTVTSGRLKTVNMEHQLEVRLNIPNLAEFTPQRVKDANGEFLFKKKSELKSPPSGPQNKKRGQTAAAE